MITKNMTWRSSFMVSVGCRRCILRFAQNIVGRRLGKAEMRCISSFSLGSYDDRTLDGVLISIHQNLP